MAAYRDTFRLLLGFAHDRTNKAPSQLDFADLDAPLDRGVLGPPGTRTRLQRRTRNARLAAIHSLFRYAALGHPEHADMIGRVLAMPNKRHDPSSSRSSPGPKPKHSSPPRHVQMVRTTRPRHARPRRPNRPTCIRTHRAHCGDVTSARAPTSAAKEKAGRNASPRSRHQRRRGHPWLGERGGLPRTPFPAPPADP